MTAPPIWTAPGTEETRVRVFRIEIERPLVGYPVLKGHLQEAVDVGGKTFLEHRPDLELAVTMDVAMADPELAAHASVLAAAAEEITWILYSRKKAEIESL